jgi:hypothetical protein
LEPIGRLRQDGHAELPPPVGDHEIDYFRRDLLGGADEVPLILTVLGVHDDDHLAGGYGVNGRFNRRKLVWHERFPPRFSFLQSIIVARPSPATLFRERVRPVFRSVGAL